LGVIAARTTARLLAEALRQLPPHQRVALIPPAGIYERLQSWMSNAAFVQGRLDAVAGLIDRCGAKHPTSEQLQEACVTARLQPPVAVATVEDYLERTESTDVVGWFRKQVYERLARVALLGDAAPFEEFHNEDFESSPVNVKELGNAQRRLLDTWL